MAMSFFHGPRMFSAGQRGMSWHPGPPASATSPQIPYLGFLVPFAQVQNLGYLMNSLVKWISAAPNRRIRDEPNAQDNVDTPQQQD